MVKSHSLLLWSQLALLLLIASPSLAESLRVIETRSNFPLTKEDPVYTDFVINAGQGRLKVGQTLKVFRKVTVTPAAQTSQGAEIKIPVGEIEIIYVDEALSIGRQKVALPSSKNPILELPSVAQGDILE